jgi:hypothetical protein
MTMNNNGKNIGRKIGKVLCFIVMGAAFVIVIGFVVMYLWNWLVPALFAGPVITFWQALGLLLLCKLLFGFPKKHHEGGWAAKKRRWREQMKDKMEHLTPEEKEKMKDHFNRCMGGRWGWKAPKEEQE